MEGVPEPVTEVSRTGHQGESRVKQRVNGWRCGGCRGGGAGGGAWHEEAGVGEVQVEAGDSGVPTACSGGMRKTWGLKMVL